MAEPQTRIDGVRQQGCTVGDAMLVSVIAVDLMYAALWLVKRNGETEFIGDTPDGCPKIDSAWPACFSDGTARLCMAQADVGGGGATSHLTWIDFPNAIQPSAPATSGGGAYVAAPDGAIAALNVAPFTGSTFLNLAALGVPLEATLLNIQVQVVAPAPNRRVIVGVAGPNTWQIVATAQAAGVEVTTNGLVTPNANHAITVVADVGDISRLEIYLLGWWI